jgi:UDP-N-acetyl-D-galactosamine dehydrogenase
METFMNLYEDIKNRKVKISLVGLGYVGLPTAVAFGKKVDVIGFDINDDKIECYKKGIDPTREVGDEALKETTVEFTSMETKLREAKFHIIAVPTPVNPDHTPNLKPIEAASHSVGRNLTKGSVVVYESTVYPGVTEEICIPILEQESGLKCIEDFKVGYSPERTNPSDKLHRLENIVKIVSGIDEEALDIISGVYELIIEAGVYKAKDIKTAEAAKVIENSQRDINIAFMNELSVIFNKMGIDIKLVLEAASTKWNFMYFSPGLVGGHCIGVDPYYLTYKAEQLGYHSQVILSGRRINDEMGKYIVENLIKKLVMADVPIRNARIAILGMTFKENCPDTRNTRVVDIIKELNEYGLIPVINDPQADLKLTEEEYGIIITPLNQIEEMDAIIIAVAHEEYLQLNEELIAKLYRNGTNHNRVLIDVKGILDKKKYEDLGYQYWSL